MNKKLIFADLFCGCGGFSLGFSQTGAYSSLAGVDSWGAAGNVFKKNMPSYQFIEANLHDQVAQQDLVNKLHGKCDVLLGGPPCQGFSTLGKRRHDDSRSGLVDVFLQMALSIQPKVILMENVRGILSMRHRSGLLYPDHIFKTLEAGKNGIIYESCHMMLDTMDFGIPQTRVRFLLIAVRKDVGGRTVAESIASNIASNKTAQRKTLKDAIGDLPHINSGEGADEIHINKDGKIVVVNNHKAMRHSAALIERFRYVPPGGGLTDVPRALLTNHLIKVLDGKYGNGGLIKNIYGRMEWDKPSGTMIAGIDKITCGRFVHPVAHRLLTPRECARIQSFPDNFVFSGSNVNQYYMIGNAVPPALSKVIAESVSSVLNSDTSHAANSSPMLHRSDKNKKVNLCQ